MDNAELVQETEGQVEGTRVENNGTQSTAQAGKERHITPEAKERMLANLKKAREAKAANRGANLKKYPVAKRERAKEMYDADVEEKAKSRAEELAKELLRKQEEEKEVAEFKQWKESK